ncbi:transmembrane protein, putative [Medicago truncatula]|uniref:Transmembrane protein, putative n=1 Tax=Medicago truncatula TaxID=3880 RepID=G7JP71_MEDTR|nr:transmembrane protein, putative [Medicago truncatula]
MKRFSLLPQFRRNLRLGLACLQLVFCFFSASLLSPFTFSKKKKKKTDQSIFLMFYLYSGQHSS